LIRPLPLEVSQNTPLKSNVYCILRSLQTSSHAVIRWCCPFSITFDPWNSEWCSERPNSERTVWIFYLRRTRTLLYFLFYNINKPRSAITFVYFNINLIFNQLIFININIIVWVVEAFGILFFAIKTMKFQLTRRVATLVDKIFLKKKSKTCFTFELRTWTNSFGSPVILLLLTLSSNFDLHVSSNVRLDRAIHLLQYYLLITVIICMNDKLYLVTVIV
jgi:hypothetical protein